MIKNSKAVHLSDDKKKEILQNAKTIVIVGLSPDTSKASYHVASFLLERGYNIIPIYPRGGEILGKQAYVSLKEAFIDMSAKNIQCDIIDIFRKSEVLPSVVGEICVLANSNIKPNLNNYEVSRINNKNKNSYPQQYILDSASTQMLESLDSNNLHVERTQTYHIESKKDCLENNKGLDSVIYPQTPQPVRQLENLYSMQNEDCKSFSIKCVANESLSVIKNGVQAENFLKGRVETKIVDSMHCALISTESETSTECKQKILNPFNANNLCIWVQLGLQNNKAAAIAKQHAVLYEEDSCIKLEYVRIFGEQ